MCAETTWPACRCGCGNPAPASKRHLPHLGIRKGDPRDYISGHNGAKSPDRYVVDPETGCWVWQRRINSQTGYGTLTHKRRSYSAHRFYYEQANGQIPAGMTIDHLCFNRACVNPAHLEAVTNAENIRRAWRRRLALGRVLSAYEESGNVRPFPRRTEESA